MIFSFTCLCLTAHPFTCLFADCLCLLACPPDCLCQPTYPTVCPHVPLSLSAHIPDCLPTCPTVSVPLPVYLSFFLPVCLPTARLPVNMSTYVFSNCLSLCTCVRLSVLLSSSKRDYPSTSCFPTRHTVCMTRCLSFRQNVQITVCHSVYLPFWFKFRSRE